jgi:hypothetical protein
VTPEIILGIIGTVGTVLCGLFLLLGKRGETRGAVKTSLDARIDARVKAELDRVYTRLDDVERLAVRRSSAFARILRAIADQWGDAHGPNLDPLDIAEVEDTIPPAWIRRSRKDTTL